MLVKLVSNPVPQEDPNTAFVSQDVWDTLGLTASSFISIRELNQSFLLRVALAVEVPSFFFLLVLLGCFFFSFF